jgi:glycerate dehydrogenase
MRSENPEPGARPRIVVADGYTTNSGDLDWGPLERLGELVVYPRLGTALEASIGDADIVLTNKEPLSGELLARLRRLRFISVLATGTNVVDLAAARARGIVVSNVPGYSTPSVVQLVFALLFELTTRTAEHAAAARDGRWTASGDFSYRVVPISEVAGKTLGIVGFGTIGRAVARAALSFGMKVAVASRPSNAHSDLPVERVELEELFAQSDVLTLHCPLSDATSDLVNAERLARMKASAFLINTGRGGLVDEPALAQALNEGRIAGAGLDVLKQEPPPSAHPLLSAKNCIVTPHLGWASREARQRLLDESVENVRSFLAGTPRNVVN